MTSIYKYMDLIYLKDALEYGVHGSKFNEVNDPYEGEGIENPNNYRIACMTNSPIKMLLWAYYVNHRGCCVEFDVPERFNSLIEKVKYDEDFADRTEMSILGVIDALKHKGKEWEHENEYRSIYYAPDVVDSSIWIEKGSSTNIFLRLPVKSVTFGIDAHKNDGYVDAIELIIDYNKRTGNNVLIHKVKKSPNKYKLIEDRQYDINSEVKKYKK